MLVRVPVGETVAEFSTVGEEVRVGVSVTVSVISGVIDGVWVPVGTSVSVNVGMEEVGLLTWVITTKPGFDNPMQLVTNKLNARIEANVNKKVRLINDYVLNVLLASRPILGAAVG